MGSGEERTAPEKDPPVEEDPVPVAPAIEPSPPPEDPPAEDWSIRFKYLFADFENFRRRTDREREQARQQGRVAVLRQLLPLLEASDRATEAARTLPANHPLRTGLELLGKEWDAFRKVEHLETVARVGYPFRSEEHEALAEVNPTEDVPEGAVVEIVQQGYRCDAGLIRAAKVVVARTSHRPAVDPESSSSNVPSA
jgi:molecular chaperone GrpE